MARAKTEVAETKDNLPVDWQDEMRQIAKAGRESLASLGGGQFFGTRGGQLTLNGSPIPDNEICAIVVDWIFEKTFYEDDFDPDNPAMPTCFAFGRAPDVTGFNAGQTELEPHEKVTDQQCEACDACEWNEFGSADRGQGKGCKDSFRLAVIAAGTPDKSGEWNIPDEEEFFEAQKLYFLRVPPTSIKAWKGYVDQVDGVFNRPPFGIFTQIKLIPDPKNQFVVEFKPLEKVPDHLMPTVFSRYKQAIEPGVVDFPYQPMSNQDEDDEPAPRRNTRKKAPAKKKAATKRGSRKY